MEQNALNNSSNSKIEKLNNLSEKEKEIKLNTDNNKTKEEEKKEEKPLIIENCYSRVSCMLKLNKINYIENGKNIDLNLVAVGFASGRIYLINLPEMTVYQIIKESNSIYSLCQFNNNNKYLICSISTGYICIYILKDNIYVKFQQLQKPNKKTGINKIISLSNGDLASADSNSISIWKKKENKDNTEINEFDFFKEIKTDEDTCHLIEVNPKVFACAIYKARLIKIFNNDENDYPLLGKIREVESHGNNSNGMAKINDKLFCLGGKNYTIYVVCVEPVQLIQKIKVVDENSLCCVDCLYMSHNGYLFASYGDNIEQFKVINVKNNFIELKEIDIIKNKESQSYAIVTTDDGKIFYQVKGNETMFHLFSFKID